MSSPKSRLIPILEQSSAGNGKEEYNVSEKLKSYLNIKDLASLSSTNKSLFTLYRNTVTAKKKASLLLTHVFDANPNLLKKFLSRLETSVPQSSSDKNCIVLTRSACKEEYFSRKKDKVMLKRIWNNISPLEAAAWCGDIFIVRELLKHVPVSQRQQAANQLQGTLDRKATEENGEFMAPYHVLLKAYREYLNHFKEEMGKWIWEKRDWHIQDTLADKIWQCQRKLPTYALQEYCDEKPFYLPTPFFNKEPKRSTLYDDNSMVDLDDDLPKGFTISKRWYGAIKLPAGFSYFPSHYGYGAMKHLYEVRKVDLINIIKELIQSALISKSDDISECEMRPAKRSRLDFPADRSGFGL